jgi:hypothetical protein
MSIVVLKKKSMIHMSRNNESFSINGGTRNIGSIGTESMFSRNGTSFKGIHPRGHGGHFGEYAQPLPVYNVNRAIIGSTQHIYTKPSIVSTRGMLRSKYRWAYSGVYPNYWVQPVNTGNLVLSSSQGVYLHNKTVKNTCVINTPNEYEGFIAKTSPTLCSTTTAGFTYDSMVRNAPYTKKINQPMTSSERTTRIQKGCANPTGAQKPFPFAVQTGKGILSGGQTKNAINCKPTPIYLTPPDWYTQ